ncbi:hypothetical protein [Paraburkholderia caffeinilytica]|uniref:hypothetical protein n=1 Tax=Paraburkholderia caffeinilytica TaxID=1761016 RepID=UPI003DA0B2C7
MNTVPMLGDVVGHVQAVSEATSAQLAARPHDPATLRSVITALGQLEDALLLAGETATLSGCRGLAGVWRVVTELHAQVSLHLHEVEARKTLIDVLTEAQRSTLH